MVEHAFTSSFSKQLREVIDSSSIVVEQLPAVREYLSSSLGIEESVVRTLQPHVKDFYSSLQHYTGLKSEDVDELIIDPKSYDALTCDIVVELNPSLFDIDNARRLLRLSAMNYIKQTQIVIYELIPRIQLQRVYILHLESELAQLRNREKELRKRIRAMKNKSAGVEVVNG